MSANMRSITWMVGVAGAWGSLFRMGFSSPCILRREITAAVGWGNREWRA
jgi:hypothetical protein